MKPTLLIGDNLIASRPLTALPERGEVWVFRHPVSSRDFIARLIGLPDDQIQMKDGVLHINGQAVTTKPDGVFVEDMAPQGPGQFLPRCSNSPVPQGESCSKVRVLETLPGGTSYGTLDIGLGPNDTTAIFTVPEGHFFVLGDNRDNSSDSRIPGIAQGIGMVPAENLIGRADWIIFSSAGRSLYDIRSWRKDRFFKAIQ